MYYLVKDNNILAKCMATSVSEARAEFDSKNWLVGEIKAPLYNKFQAFENVKSFSDLKSRFFDRCNKRIPKEYYDNDACVVIYHAPSKTIRQYVNVYMFEPVQDYHCYFYNSLNASNKQNRTKWFYEGTASFEFSANSNENFIFVTPNYGYADLIIDFICDSSIRSIKKLRETLENHRSVTI